jgi:hypothetical protein
MKEFIPYRIKKLEAEKKQLERDLKNPMMNILFRKQIKKEIEDVDFLISFYQSAICNNTSKNHENNPQTIRNNL